MSNVKKWGEYLNENSNSELINLWNEYLKLVDIIDGILSEHGELSDAYWQTGLAEELDSITEVVKTTKDVSDNKERIIKNAKSLLDGLTGWDEAGKSLSRYGSLLSIKTSLFK